MEEIARPCLIEYTFSQWQPTLICI